MDDTDDDIEAIRQRTFDGLRRCATAMLIAVGRDYQRCGKAACARSRRCRGFACRPDIAEGET